MTLTTTNDFGSQLAELEKIYDVCRKLMMTPHYKKLGEEGVHAIIAKAKALGISPFEALNGGFYCINGKVGMSTEMMNALVRQRGHSIVQVESTNEKCILKGKRIDTGDEWTCSFTVKDAQDAGLWNGATWRKYPKVMLYNRCMSMLFRQLFADLSLGAGYVKDEIDEITKSGDYAHDLPVAESEEVKSPVPVAIEYEKPTAEQATSLEEIIAECSPEYQKKFYDQLETRKWKSAAQMSIQAYEATRTQALLKRAEYAATFLTVEDISKAVEE
jgi:hypothetical protein